jgi:hypothetical protein
VSQCSCSSRSLLISRMKKKERTFFLFSRRGTPFPSYVKNHITQHCLTCPAAAHALLYDTLSIADGMFVTLRVASDPPLKNKIREGRIRR